MNPTTEQHSLIFLDGPPVVPVTLPQMSGLEIKANILGRHQANNAAVLTRVRRAKLMLLLSGVETVTADDLYLTAQVPNGIDPRCLGAVPMPLAKARIIHHDGYRSSLRPEAHAHPLRVWRLVDRVKAEQLLATHPVYEVQQ